MEWEWEWASTRLGFAFELIFGSNSVRFGSMRCRAKGDEDPIQRSIASHQATALDIGNEIQSMSKLNVLTRFLLFRFRPGTMLVVISRPRSDSHLPPRMKGRGIMLSRLPKRYQCRRRINGQWVWVDQTLHTQIHHRWSTTTVESDHAHLHRPTTHTRQSLKYTPHTATNQIRQYKNIRNPLHQYYRPSIQWPLRSLSYWYWYWFSFWLVVASIRIDIDIDIPSSFHFKLFTENDSIRIIPFRFIS